MRHPSRPSLFLVLAGLAASCRGLKLLRNPMKADLLLRIQRGDAEEEIISAAQRLEWLNPARLTGAVASEQLGGRWLMVFTTSDSIAGKNRPALFQTRTPPEQLIDVAAGRACNSETVLGFTNAVDIALQPATRNRVDVKFEKFRVGPLAFPAPASLRGSLDTTYLDEDMRISRGDKENLFILLRASESSMREMADAVWAGWRASW
jgi:hypothetical protein